MTKKIFKLILVLSLGVSSLFALQKETLKEDMSKEIIKVQKILKNTEYEKDVKKEKIVEIINNIFDYKLMAKISLGKKWKSISKEQRKEFTELFENRLKYSYVEKLDLYTDEEVIIKELETYKKSRLILNTEIIGKDATYIINYKFYNNKRKKEWMVYDVDIVGVSIIQTYRKQFAGLLKEKTFDELLQVLREQK